MFQRIRGYSILNPYRLGYRALVFYLSYSPNWEIQIYNPSILPRQWRQGKGLATHINKACFSGFLDSKQYYSKPSTIKYLYSLRSTTYQLSPQRLVITYLSISQQSIYSISNKSNNIIIRSTPIAILLQGYSIRLFLYIIYFYIIPISLQSFYIYIFLYKTYSVKLFLYIVYLYIISIFLQNFYSYILQSYNIRLFLYIEALAIF